MRISDWSSDVCSSDLNGLRFELRPGSYEIHFIETQAGRGGGSTQMFHPAGGSQGRLGSGTLVWFLTLLFVAAIALLWLTGTGKRWLAPWHLDGQTSEAFVDFPLVEVRPVIASGKAESGTAEIVTFQLTDALRRTGWLRIRSATPEPGSSEDAPPDYRLRSRLYGKGNDLSLAVELVQADNDLVVWTHEVPIRAAARGPDQLAWVSMSLASSRTRLRGAVVERALHGYPDMPAPGYPCVVRTLAFDMDRTAAEYGRLHMWLEQTSAMRPQMSRARTLLARLKQDNLDFHYAPAGDDSPRGVIRLAASAVEQDPNDSMALMDLAFLQLRYGDYQRARANAEQIGRAHV